MRNWCARSGSDPAGPAGPAPRRSAAATAILGSALWALLAAMLWAAFLAGAAVAQDGASRVALVIGNSRYETVSSLENPGNDARDIALALELRGFEVLLGLDAGREETIQLVARFAEASRDAEVALLYYAGHAIQVDSENYIIPTDAEIVAPDAKGDAPETDSLDADMPRFVHHHAPDEEGAQEAPGAEEDFAAEAEDASAPEAFAARDTLAEDMADPAGEEGRDMAGEDEGAEVDLKALEARIAGFETAVAQQDEEWEPDGTPDDTYAGHPVSPLPWRDSDEAAEAAETPDDAPGQGAPPDVEAAPKDTAEAGQWDMAEDRSYDRPEAAAGDDEDDAESWYAEDTIIDEEALRDMVSEIVRQELQGALGERITRNVRKLVRREIHRALMSQDFD